MRGVDGGNHAADRSADTQAREFVMMEPLSYPLLFTPLFEAADGQDHLLRAYLADSDVDLPPGMGCCWALLDAEGCSSQVALGPAAGSNLGDLTRRWSGELVGRRHRAGQAFPICVRLLQTGRQEPLTVHPERPTRPDVGSNTKFWYALAAEPDATIISGIQPSATRPGFLAHLNSPMLRQSLHVYRPERYDAFLAPAGRVHALGAGCLVIEIQERPAGALCVSGWGPEDAVPESAAMAALDQVQFSDRLVRRIPRDASPVRQTRKVPLLPQCPSFRVDEVRLYDHLAGRTVGLSFHLYIVAEGRVRISCRQGEQDLAPGRVALLPACLGDYRLETLTPQALLLKVNLPE